MKIIKIIDENGKLFGKLNMIDFLVILLLFFIVPLFYFGHKAVTQKPVKGGNVLYRKQLNELNEIENSLKEFIDFIEFQKTKLRETESTLIELKKEEKKLRPIVEADRKAIEAIFELQAERNRVNVWKERAVGSFLAVLFTSIYFSLKGLVIFLIKKFKNIILQVTQYLIVKKGRSELNK